MTYDKDKPNSPQDHGGNIYSPDTNAICDFSASINPLGQPEGLAQALTARWNETLHYPDRHSTELTGAISEYYGIAAENIIVANGSTELIDLIFRTLQPRRALLCPPDFGLYWRAAARQCEIVTVERVEAAGFMPDFTGIKKVLQEGDLVVLSNPANPSGVCASKGDIVSLAKAAGEAGAHILVDEAFMDFNPDQSVIGEVGETESFSVLRSMTKFFGIPGVRLGFLAGSTELVGKIGDMRLPWSVSRVAQIAGVHCLGDEYWSARTLEYVERARAKLSDDLSELPGFSPIRSTVNYVLVRLEPPAPDASQLYEALKEQGTLVRHCGSFGLGESYVRMAVRSVGENVDMVQHLQRIIDAGQSS